MPTLPTGRLFPLPILCSRTLRTLLGAADRRCGVMEGAKRGGECDRKAWRMVDGPRRMVGQSTAVSFSVRRVASRWLGEDAP